MMTCPTCNEKNGYDRMTCGGCGVALPEAEARKVKAEAASVAKAQKKRGRPKKK